MISKQEYTRQQEDGEIGLALLDALEQEGKALASLDVADRPELRPLPPLRLKQRHTFRKKAVIWTAGIAAVLCLLVVNAKPVAAVVGDFCQWVLGKGDTYITVTTGPGGVGNAVNWSGHYLPEYVPDGFASSNVEISGDTTILEYTNEAGESFYFWQMLGACNGVEDGEQSEDVAAVTVCGKPGLLFQESGEVRLNWGTAPHFILNGPLSPVEAMRIAESVIFVE